MIYIKVGDIIQDYTIINVLPERKIEIKCNICGHTKIISISNALIQNLGHSNRNCKIDYYKHEYMNKMFGDYKVVDILHKDNHFLIVLQCEICGNIVAYNECDLISKKHSIFSCGEKYLSNVIGQKFGDYEVISFLKYENGYYYYNVECSVCHTKCVKSLLSLERSRFKHGDECFKVLDGDYKEEIARRFGSIKQRCNNKNSGAYKHYGGRGIQLKYKYTIDFYLDFIDDFREFAKIHGVRNTTFDRINVYGDYEKSNLRLATQELQSTNTTRKTYFILEKGEEKVLSDSAMAFGRKYNINGRAIGNLVRGVSKSSYGWKLLKKSHNLDDIKDISVTTKLIIT